jgi:[ribosomal protein S5]-alanine N-acetyltransferase
VRSYFLTSARLGFGTWTRDDLPLAEGIWGDPEVTRFHGGPRSTHQIAERLDVELANAQHHQVQYWPIYLRETDEHVGCCGLRPYDKATRIFEMGCHLRRAFWSRSLGREAAAAVIGYAFGSLNIRALHAGHHPDNDASRRFLLHLGFTYTHDEYYPPTRRVEPCYRLTESRAGDR